MEPPNTNNHQENDQRLSHAALLRLCSQLQSPASLGAGDALATLSDGDQQLLQQLVASAPRLVTGSSIRLHLRDHLRLLPTGCPGVDQLLLEGLREGTVTEVAGETASGKTQLCMSAAVVTAQRGEHVVYVDTSNAFCPLRTLQLAQAWTQQAGNTLSAESVLQHIRVVRLHDIYTLLALLEQLAASMAAEQDPTQRPRLLVIDSVAAVVSPILGHHQHKQSAVLVPALGWLLRNLTQRFDLATLVTNNVVGAGPGLGAATSSSRAPAEAAPVQGEAVQGSLGLVKPALGKEWRAQAHSRLLLTRKEGVITAILLTSSMAPSGGQAHFCITDKGLVSPGG